MGSRAAGTRGIIFCLCTPSGIWSGANVNGPSYQCLLKVCAAAAEDVKRHAITFCTHVMNAHTAHTNTYQWQTSGSRFLSFDRRLDPCRFKSPDQVQDRINQRGAPAARIRCGPLLTPFGSWYTNLVGTAGRCINKHCVSQVKGSGAAVRALLILLFKEGVTMLFWTWSR